MNDSRTRRIASAKRAVSAQERAHHLEAKVARDDKTISGLQNRLVHLEAAQTAVAKGQQMLPPTMWAAAQGLVFPDVLRVLTRGTTTNDPRAAVQNAAKSNGAYTRTLKERGVLAPATVDAALLLGPGSPFYRRMPDGSMEPTLRNGTGGRLEQRSNDHAGNNANLWMPVYSLSPFAWLDEKARLEAALGEKRASARAAAARAAVIRATTSDQIYAGLSALAARPTAPPAPIAPAPAAVVTVGGSDAEWGLFEMPLPTPSGRH